MSNRKLIFLIFLMIGIFFVVKYDLITKAKIRTANMIYGNEINEIKSFRIMAVLPPHIEKEGLTSESIRENMASMLAKAGIQSLTEKDEQKNPDKPTLIISVQALKQPEQHLIYQYIILIEVTTSPPGNTAAGTSQEKKIWSASEAGLGDINDIRREIIKITNEFMDAHAGG